MFKLFIQAYDTVISNFVFEWKMLSNSIFNSNLKFFFIMNDEIVKIINFLIKHIFFV